MITIKTPLDESPLSRVYDLLCRQLRAAAAPGWHLRLADARDRLADCRGKPWHEPWSARLCPGIRLVVTSGETVQEFASSHEAPLMIDCEIGLREPVAPEFLRAWGAVQSAFYPSDDAAALANRQDREGVGLYRPMRFGPLSIERTEVAPGVSLAVGTIEAWVRHSLRT